MYFGVPTTALNTAGRVSVPNPDLIIPLPLSNTNAGGMLLPPPRRPLGDLLRPEGDFPRCLLWIELLPLGLRDEPRPLFDEGGALRIPLFGAKELLCFGLFNLQDIRSAMPFLFMMTCLG